MVFYIVFYIAAFFLFYHLIDRIVKKNKKSEQGKQGQHNRQNTVIKKPAPRTVHYVTPSGDVWSLFVDALKQPHLLIAGTTGSGKSVLENGLINTLLYRLPFDQPECAQLILIDPKGNELYRYRNLPHTLRYAGSEESMVNALRYAVSIMEERQMTMRQYEDEDYYLGSDIYVFIDEFADLMTTRRKDVQPLVQRLSQRGRSARVHVVLCTQSPLRDVIPTVIKCNFDARFGLRTRSAQDSRNILGMSGLETYPVYGEGYYMKPKTSEDEEITEGKYKIPYVTKAEIKQNINWWYDQMQQNGLNPRKAA